MLGRNSGGPCEARFPYQINFKVLRGVQTRYVVLDEADMMLSMGFSEDVETILESVPVERQTMLFSATMPAWVKNITKRHLKNPALVDLVGDSQSGKMPDSIKCGLSPPPVLVALPCNSCFG